MHYSNLVVIDKTDDVEKAVESAMGPSSDGGGGFWDWYQIGGRWTGALDGYDPEKDPANHENGKAKWPTQWAKHPGDIMPIEQLTQEHLDKFFRVVVDSEKWGRDVFGGEKYVPWNKEEPFLKLEMPPLEWLKQTFSGCIVVVVDNHN